MKPYDPERTEVHIWLDKLNRICCEVDLAR